MVDRQVNWASKICSAEFSVTPLPKFEVLSGNNAMYENYFVRFYLLILLDKLFVQLYRWMLETTDF